MYHIYTGSTRERLDKFLHVSYPDLSRAQLQKFLRGHPITVNGKTVDVHHWLKNGDVIEGPEPAIQAPDARESRATGEPEIIDQTDEYAVVLKPAGLLMHPTDRNETDTLAAWLVARFPQIAKVGDDLRRPGIVHRLDRDVGGLVLVTLRQDAFGYFKRQFASHTIAKRYRCLVHGKVGADEGTISIPLERDKKTGRMTAQSGTQQGKEAVTLYQVITRFPQYTLLDIEIVTGRTHQIRAHLFSIGHSIVGDVLYTTRDVRKKRIASPLDRPFLYAYALSFRDPNGQKRDYTVELPQDLKNFLSTLTHLA